MTSLALRLMVNLFGLSTELGMRDAVELEYIFIIHKGFVIQLSYLHMKCRKTQNE